MPRGGWEKLRRVLQRARDKSGPKAALSEVLFAAARATATDRTNSAYENPADLRLKVRRLNGKLELERDKRRRTQELSKKRKALTAELQATLTNRKKRLARVSSELKELRQGGLSFYESRSLADLQCPICSESGVLVSPYPYPRTTQFRSLICSWCEHCGFGWVPGLPFSLTEYYENTYAKLNRGDRDDAPEIYFERLLGATDTANGLGRYRARAERQLKRIEELTEDNYCLLDYGAGPGYALFLSQAATKHAIEPDENSKKYLRHIGATSVELETLREKTYDAVLSSHSLEHLEAAALLPTLLRIRRSLKAEGLFYCEVPNGALTEVYKPKRHEPHTLFFNQKNLRLLFERAGFRVLNSFSGEEGMGTDLETPVSRTHAPQAGTAEALTVVARKDERAESLLTRTDSTDATLRFSGVFDLGE